MQREGRLQVLEAQQRRARAAGDKLEQLPLVLAAQGPHHLRPHSTALTG